MGFLGSLVGKESAYNVGETRDTGSILGLIRSPGEGHENPLQYSCLENPVYRGACRLHIVHSVAESEATLSRSRLKQVSTNWDGRSRCIFP